MMYNINRIGDIDMLQTQTIDIVKGNLTVTENNKNITFTYNNSIIKITDKLTKMIR